MNINSKIPFLPLPGEKKKHVPLPVLPFFSFSGGQEEIN